MTTFYKENVLNLILKITRCVQEDKVIFDKGQAEIDGTYVYIKEGMGDEGWSSYYLLFLSDSKLERFNNNDAQLQKIVDMIKKVVDVIRKVQVHYFFLLKK
jgi:hypothetical protein